MNSLEKKPETDELVRTQMARVGMTPSALAAKLTLKSEELERERNALREAIRLTIMENLHLADGENCTLKRLKDAIGFELPPEED